MHSPVGEMVSGRFNYDIVYSNERFIKKSEWNEAMKLAATTLSSEEPPFELASDIIFLSFAEIKVWNETLWRKFFAKYRLEGNLVSENKKALVLQLQSSFQFILHSRTRIPESVRKLSHDFDYTRSARHSQPSEYWLVDVSLRFAGSGNPARAHFGKSFFCNFLNLL